MAREERKEYMKEYYEKNKEKRLKYHKKWREKNKEKVRERMKKWYDKNRDKQREKHKKYNEINNEKILERQREYRKNNHEIVILINRIFRYYSRDYYRFITLKNYLTIMKLEDFFLKRSIMIKLGHGTILQDEAVALSGMVWTDEDQKQLTDYLKKN